MSGHSKWANIKRKKQANDKLKGNIFAKLSKAITLAVVEGGGFTDPNLNIKLRFALDQARRYNMPRETIERAVQKASSENKNTLQSVLYEAFGPAGIAFLIEGTTDNPHRTVSEVRNILDLHGSKLGLPGAAQRLFQEALEVRMQADADTILSFIDYIKPIDIFEEDGDSILLIPFHQAQKLIAYRQEHNSEFSDPQRTYYILNPVDVVDEEIVRQITDLTDKLEELDDIEKVYANSSVHI